MSFTNANLTDDEPIENSNALFLGDKGTLCFESRKVLVQLLAGPLIDARRHSKNWSTLLRNEEVIRCRLAEIFLELILDQDLQVAFTRQVDAGDLEIPTLLRSAQLTFIDSVLVLYLRQLLAQADAQDVRATTSQDEIEEYLSLYERASNTDKAGFIKKVRASIEKVKKYNILQKIRSHEKRFEISPTLKLIFSTEEIQALTKLYQDKSIPTNLEYSEENL
jgi:hypothetical protein